MLVVSRHVGESLMIGDDIVVEIVDIRPDKVRIGIACPNDTSVHRREIYDALRSEESDRQDPLGRTPKREG